MECHKGLVHAELDNESRTVTVTENRRRQGKEGCQRIRPAYVQVLSGKGFRVLKLPIWGDQVKKTSKDS